MVSTDKQKNFRLSGIRLSYFLILLSLLMVSCKDTEPDMPIDPDPIEDPVVAIGSVSHLVNDSIGDGFNLGNVYDNGINSAENITEIKAIIDLYKSAGMKHVRIPVTWTESVGGSTLLSETGQIRTTNSRFSSLVNIINYALQKDMYVVLNAHHERGLKENYNGSAASKAEIATLWTAIANYFKDYSFRLVFEVLNEPDGAFGDWDGVGPDPFNAQAIGYTREVFSEGVKAIRATGGRNETRTVMISTNGMGNHSMIDEVYPAKAQLPGGGTDKYLIIQVHTYDPWAFCGQDGNNNQYPGDQAIRQSLLATAQHASLLNVPVNYGEFGVGRASNQNTRNTELVRGYYKTMISTCRENGMSTSVWDDRGWFGLVTKSGSNFVFLYNIVPNMLTN